MKVEGTLDELQTGVHVPLDEVTTIVLLPSATVKDNVYLYGKRDEVFALELIGRPKSQQRNASGESAQTTERHRVHREIVWARYGLSDAIF